MDFLHENLKEYKKQIEQGVIKSAYQGLMNYIKDLRLHFDKNYPNYLVSSNIHYGFMDYSYFYFTTAMLKKLGLKIVIVFIHESFTFKVVLSGYNKGIQEKYWKMFREKVWNKYTVVPSIKDLEYFVEYELSTNSDFSDLDLLTQKLEKGITSFTKDMEKLVTGI